MEHVDRIIADTHDLLDELTQTLMEAGRDRLLVMDVDEKRGVWVHEGTEWEKLSDVPGECPLYYPCMCCVYDGFIVCGGSDASYQPVSQCHHFHVQTRKWRKLSDMPTPRSSASAVQYNVRKILVAGGYDSGLNDLAVCEILDYTSNNWSAAPNLPKPLWKPLIATDSRFIFILPCGNALNQPALLRYDPSSPTGMLTSSRYIYGSKLPNDVHTTRGACLVASNHKLYLLGGRQGLALEYNQFTDQWHHLTPPSFGYSWVYGCCAGVEVRGLKLYGGSTKDKEKRDMVEMYNIRKCKWQVVDVRLPFPYNCYSNLVARFSVLPSPVRIVH